MKIPVINSYLLSQWYSLSKRREEVRKVEEAKPKEETKENKCKHERCWVDEFRKGHTDSKGETVWFDGKWKRITCKDCGYSHVEKIKRLDVKA